MKGLILSGGRGTRLRPLTYTSAKQLVPVANKPVLFYGIEAIRDAGIEEIGIVVGDTKEDIKKAVGDGSGWGVRVSYVEQPEPLGLAHAVLISEDFLTGEPFVMYLGDNLIMGGINSLVEEFSKERPNSQVLLARVPNPEQFGVAELTDGHVVRLEEKPRFPKSDLALVGVYMFDATVFEAVKNIKPSRRHELEITDAIQYLIDKGLRVSSHIIDGWWKDTGKLEDILEANRMLLDRLDTRVEGEVDGVSSVSFKVVLEKGSQVVGSTIRGPAIIGEGAQIVHSFVGPFTSVGPRVRIEGSEIQDSIVMEGSSIVNISETIVDSLIGRNVEIASSASRPRAHRFMIGDYSKVGLL